MRALTARTAGTVALRTVALRTLAAGTVALGARTAGAVALRTVALGAGTAGTVALRAHTRLERFHHLDELRDFFVIDSGNGAGHIDGFILHAGEGPVEIDKEDFSGVDDRFARLVEEPFAAVVIVVHPHNNRADLLAFVARLEHPDRVVDGVVDEDAVEVGVVEDTVAAFEFRTRVRERAD